MRASDMESPHRGVRVPRDSLVDLESRCRAYAELMPASGFFCLGTAAQLWRLPIPARLESDPLLHVAVRSPERAVRVAGIRGHKYDASPADVCVLRGLRVSTVSRTWRDLSRILSVPELVAAGDRIVHWRAPLTTMEELARASMVGRARPGAGRLVRAFELLDQRSESPAESRLRAMLALAGLNGWQANYPVRVPGRAGDFRLDLAMPTYKVAIEYQGGYHHDIEQWRRDMSRLSRLRADGWEVIEVNSDDFDDPAELVARVSAVLRARGYRPATK